MYFSVILISFLIFNSSDSINPVNLPLTSTFKITLYITSPFLFNPDIIDCPILNYI